MEQGGTWDFIVVGAGSAGSALASRLSEDPKLQVLLLEAGAASHPYSSVPMSFAFLMNHPTANWNYRSTPEESTANRVIPVPRGRLVGGSSSINGLVYVRGQPVDYDSWAQFGNRGWSYESVLPVFRRMENYEHGSDDWRTQGGPLHVCEAYDRNPIYDALQAAGDKLGIPRNRDYNGADQEGIVRTQTTIRDGRRMSAAVAYLKPARGRPNLTIVADAHATRLLFDGTRCLGVAYERHGQEVEARAGREVVVSSGAVATPQLLELSGIGRPEVLQRHGIAVRHALAGVGEQLRDHINARIIWRLKSRGLSYNDRIAGLGKIWEGLKYIVGRRGFLAIPSAPMLGFLKTRPDLDSADIQMHVLPYVIKDPTKRTLQEWPGLTLTCYQLRPESLGSIHIKSADPKVHPDIRFNFLSDPLDRRTMIDGLKLIRRLANAGPLDPYLEAEVDPGPGATTDDDLLDSIRRTANTAFHPIGTCRMAPGPNGVVDDRLRVHGLQGLRIADASIMPTMVSGNTNAASIMIGEKASDLIREDLRVSA